MPFQTLDEQFATINARLERIEAHLALSAPSKSVESVESVEPLVSSLPATQTKEKATGNWLGVSAVLCFVLAAGFIIQLSINSGWLTPGKRIGLAILLGIALIGAGLKLLKSDRPYASFLPAAGIVVLYLASYAAHSYYSLISFEFTIAAAGLISCLCIGLYTRLKHDVYAFTAAVGAYIAPVIAGMQENSVFSLYYFLLCSITFATISIWVKSRTFTLLSSYFAILMTGLIGLTLGATEYALVASLLALHFLVFSIGTYLYSLQNSTPLSEKEAWSFLPILLLFYALEYCFIGRIQPGLAPWLSLLFAGLLIGLYVSARRYFPDHLGSQNLILTFVSIVFFHSVYLQLLPDVLRPWLFVCITLCITFFPHASSLVEAKDRSFLVPKLLVLIIIAIEYLRIVFHLIDKNNLLSLPVAFAAFVSLWIALMCGKKSSNSNGHTLLIAAHLLAVLGLYRLTSEFGSLAVSAAWLSYGALVVVAAFNSKDRIMAKSALFVLAFAAGKALLYDAASAPTALRIVCLLLTGAVLYGCGLFMRQINNWEKEKQV